MIKILNQEDCQIHYQSIYPWVDKAMEYSAGETTTDQVMEKLTNGNALCWVIADEKGDATFVATTEIIQYPSRKVLHLITGSGNWDDMAKEGHSLLEEFAYDTGCESIVIWGRAGWARALRNNFKSVNGNRYEQEYVVMSMSIKHKGESI